MPDTHAAIARLAVVSAMTISFACSGQILSPSGGGSSDPDADPTGALPPEDPTRPGVVRDCDSFEAVPPRVYAAKVKSLLLSMPLTADELGTLQGDPAAFPAMVAGWVDSEGADAKLLDFFATTFQQDGFEEQDLADLIGMDRLQMGRFSDRTEVRDIFQQSFRESFARIVLDYVREGRSFQEVLTTDEGYYTPAQLLALAYRDDFVHDDQDDEYYRTAQDRLPRLVFQNHTPTPARPKLEPIFR